jgi:phosphoglycerate dehydrogenase-like enzyme
MTDTVEVLITIPFADALIARLQSISPRLIIKASRARKPEDVRQEDWLHAEVLYTSRVLPTPEQAPALRWIQFHWAGVDHAAALPILQKPDVIATTLSGAASTQVAEYILMMLLALGHKLPDLGANQRKAEWPRERWERFSPRELRGSTVGIVGYGSIGRQVARLLQPFGARVLATKRDAMHPDDAGYTAEGFGDQGGDLVHRLYPPEAIKSMLRECDFVVVCAPLTLQTRNLLNGEALAAMRPTACLVDISRGGIVEPGALVSALRERKIAGAALDVFVEEPLPEDHPLWQMPNVIITPHISGNTPGYDERAADLFAENLRRYLNGLPLYNRFVAERGY